MIGALSFLHDVNALGAARRLGLSLTIVLVDNDGGGIFSFLPQRTSMPARFETWWGTPHGVDLRHAVALHGGRHALLEPMTGFWNRQITEIERLILLVLLAELQGESCLGEFVTKIKSMGSGEIPRFASSQLIEELKWIDIVQVQATGDQMQLSTLCKQAIIHVFELCG